MKKKVFLLFLVTFSISSKSQTTDFLITVINNKDLPPKEIINAYRELCQTYVVNDPVKTMHYARHGLNLAKKEKDTELIAKFNEYMGISYSKKAIYDTAHIYLDRSLELAVQTQNMEQEGSSYISIAASFHRQHKQEIALENYLKALPIYKKTGNDSQYVKALANIGGIYRSLKNSTLAISYLDEARQVAERNNDLNGLLKIYYDLGVLFFDSENYNQALLYEMKAIDISRQIGNKNFELACLQVIAVIYMKGYNDYKTALKYTNESLTIAEKLGNQERIAGVWNTLSNIYLNQKNYYQSKEAALKVYQLDSANWARSINAFMNIAKANIYLDKKEEAINYIDRFESSYHKYLDKDFQEKVANLEVKYDTEKKELYISSLEKEKILYRWLMIAGIIIFSLALILLLIGHRLIAHKKNLAEQKVKQLEQEKQLIATQAILEGETKERSRLARDLHDGLGSMLSVLKLNIQERYSRSEDIGLHQNDFNKLLSTVDQITTELRRIAHHMMPESLMNNGLKIALNDFCLSIPNAYFQFIGEDKRLESRFEILIYRCTYELVNNALKHANATRIDVQLMTDNKLISLTVRDNGCGFELKKSDESGLNNIRTRVSSYNGKMNIYSVPGQGSEISIEIENY